MRALALSACLLVLGAPSLASADDTCAIEGTIQGIEISVRSPRGRLRRVRVDAPTRVSVTPLRSGLSRIRTLDPLHGDVVEGTTRAPLRFVLARAIALRTESVALPEGLPIERVRTVPTGAWLEIDVAIGDDLFLRRAAVPCDALAVVDADREIIALGSASPLSGPRWRSRTTRLDVFDTDDGERSLRLDVGPEARARFVELERRGPWVRIALLTALGARVLAWVHDWDLVA